MQNAMLCRGNESGTQQRSGVDQRRTLLVCASPSCAAAARLAPPSFWISKRWLRRDKETGKQRGFAFLAYEDQRSTVLAVDNLSGARVAGRIVKVDHVDNYKVKCAEVGHSLVGRRTQAPARSASTKQTTTSWSSCLRRPCAVLVWLRTSASVLTEQRRLCLCC